MEQLLKFFILTPLLGYFLSLLLSHKREKPIFFFSLVTIILHSVFFVVLGILWGQNNFPDLYFSGPVLYQSSDFKFSLDFFFDTFTCAYIFVTEILVFMVMIFSRFYMHRDRGFKRFFTNIILFFLGLNFILFSGNLETLFIGWEIIGVSSFFLISFYRDRYLPVKNALKVVSIYRLADISLLFCIWSCHHYFHKNLTFMELKSLFSGSLPAITEEPYRTLIPLLFLLVAAIKSAQFPFSFWLPRAMEGPTTSSAIFYGSLSVHIGLFLMLRTYYLWDDNQTFKLIMIMMGLSTSVISSLIARVQSSVKTQIAYSSISQIGLMFVELALGFHSLLLLHFASNAFLRTYQLLVSPSVLSYLIHDQFFNFIPPKNEIKNNLFGRIKASIYVLSLKEWQMDSFMYHFLWKPLKKFSNSLPFINAKTTLFIFSPLYLVGLYFSLHKERLPQFFSEFFPIILLGLSFLMSLKAFGKRSDAQKAFFLVSMSQLYLGLGISFNEEFAFSELSWYSSGIIISFLLGYLCIYLLRKSNEPVALDRFQGHSLDHPLLGFVFALACLGLAGFPVTPTFIGEDLILGHVHDNQIFLALMVSFTLIISGLSVFRVYSRLFTGPSVNGHHEKAYRSS